MPGHVQDKGRPSAGAVHIPLADFRIGEFIYCGAGLGEHVAEAETGVDVHDGVLVRVDGGDGHLLEHGYPAGAELFVKEVSDKALHVLPGQERQVHETVRKREAREAAHVHQQDIRVNPRTQIVRD